MIIGWVHIFRPPDIVVGELKVLPRILLSSFFRQILSALAERNSTKPGHMFGSDCDLKMHVRNLGYPIPLEIGAQKHLFRRLRNLKATLTAYIFWTKHDVDNRALATRTGGLKTIWTLVHTRFQIGPPFLPTLRKFCVLLHCQASQTDNRKRNSTKLYQTVNSKLR